MPTMIAITITDPFEVMRLAEFARRRARARRRAGRPPELRELIDGLHADLLELKDERRWLETNYATASLELFPPLGQVKPWDWAETNEGEPVVLVERHASFTGLDSGAVDLTAPIPNTSKIGVWRIDPSGHYTLKGLADDPLAVTAAQQAPLN